MYNGMIAPLKPFAIRGAIWYQGEANVGNGLKYYDKMKALIEGWRKVWGYDFPFYFVQTRAFSGYKPGSLPPLWEAQVASLKIPGTGMVVTTDLVENINDIHPKNKLDVGNRLALWALAKDYGKKDLVYSGPLYKSMKVEGNKIRLSFAHVGGGLKSRDGKPLTEFEIAGADGKFVARRGHDRRRHGRRPGQGGRHAHPGPVRLAERGKSEPGQQGGPARLAVPDQQLAGRHGRVSTRTKATVRHRYIGTLMTTLWTTPVADQRGMRVVREEDHELAR